MDSYESSDIVPNRGISPFVVGMTEQELFKVIPANTPKRSFGTCYTVKVGSITLWIDRTSKQVTQVGVSKGYTGSVFGAVKIGTSAKDAEKIFGNFVINGDYQLVVPEIPGISFQLSPALNELSPKPMEDALIDGIYVYRASNA